MLKPPAFASRDPAGTAAKPRANQSGGNGARTERKKGADAFASDIRVRKYDPRRSRGGGDERGVSARARGGIRPGESCAAPQLSDFCRDIYPFFIWG